MSEVLPARFIDRWYRVRLPGDTHLTQLFAERYFDSIEDALLYREQRSKELAPRHVHSPVPSREDPTIWAVCVEP